MSILYSPTDKEFVAEMERRRFDREVKKLLSGDLGVLKQVDAFYISQNKGLWIDWSVIWQNCGEQAEWTRYVRLTPERDWNIKFLEKL
jgi:hypothetical protein